VREFEAFGIQGIQLNSRLIDSVLEGEGLFFLVRSAKRRVFVAEFDDILVDEKVCLVFNLVSLRLSF